MNESLLCVFSTFRLFRKPLQVPSSAAEKTQNYDLTLGSSPRVVGEDARTEKLGG